MSSLVVENHILAQSSQVWSVLTDLEKLSGVVTGIQHIEILEKPIQGFTGTKWRETRKMFGKTAQETMWITESKVNEFFTTQAESHGSVYRSRFELLSIENGCRLSITFEAEVRSKFARVVNYLLFPLFKGATRKALEQDLEDIKTYVEGTKSS